MTIAHAEVSELLEGYALWALDAEERVAVESHLAECDLCRTEARELERVVDAIPETVAERSPSARLRERVLAAARADVRRVPRSRSAFLRPAWAVAVALLVVSAVSGGAAVRAQQELSSVRADRDRLAEIAYAVSEGGRWWYMSGVGAFDGSGGTLIEPNKDRRAFVLFHELRALAPGERYAIWMIRADGSWARAANFTPSSDELQRVDVPLAVSEFVQCAVTVETRDAGPRAGPTAMQSRVFGN